VQLLVTVPLPQREINRDTWTQRKTELLLFLICLFQSFFLTIYSSCVLFERFLSVLPLFLSLVFCTPPLPFFFPSFLFNYFLLAEIFLYLFFHCVHTIAYVYLHL
jgi:hypothetical protein